MPLAENNGNENRENEVERIARRLAVIYTRSESTWKQFLQDAQRELDLLRLPEKE